MHNLPKKLLSKKTYLVSLSFILSLLLIIAGYFYYDYSTQLLQKDKEEELRAIAHLKIDQIVQWHKERTADANVVSHEPFFIDGILNWLKNKNNISVTNDIKSRLSNYQVELGYDAIFLVSPDAEILLAAGSDLNQFDKITSEKIKEAANNDSITFTDFYHSETENEIHFDIIAPLINDLNETIALLVLRRNPAEYLYPTIQAWPTPSKSAETYLFKIDRDSILFLTELRHQKNTALKLRLPISKKNIIAVQAAIGRTGIFMGKDYRGTDVLAYLSAVPSTNWFIVSKVDSTEVFSELKYREGAILIFIIILILLLAAGLAWFYSLRQKNIYKVLAETQEEFKTTLYSIGDGVITTDINGRIKYINSVAEKLTGWEESEAKGKALKDIFKIINEETRIKVENAVQKVIRAGTVVGLSNHTILISKDGKEIPIAESGAPIKNEAEEIVGVVLVFRDQTEERTAQKEILRLNRVYAMLSNTNQLIVRTHEKQKLLSEICRIAIDDGKLKMAWIGMVDRTTNKVNTAAAAGAVADYLEKMKIDLADEIQSQCPMGRVIKTEKHFILNDIENDNAKTAWKANALRLGYKAAAAFPVKVFGNTIGGFTFYSDIKDFFQTEEIRLLDEMATDISFALEFIESEMERKNAEKKVAKERIMLRTIIDNLPDAIYSKDLSYRKTLANKADLENMGDVREADVIGKTDFEFFPLDIAKKFNEDDKNIIENGKSIINKEESFVDKSGNIRWLLTSKVPLKNASGEIEGLIGIGHDITERKKAIEALKESEKKFRTVIEETAEIIFTTDIRGYFTYVNPAGLKASGYSFDELTKLRYTALIEPEYSNIVTKAYVEQFKNRTDSTTVEYLFRTKTGEKKWFNQNANLIIENDQVYGFYVIARDVTERKKAEIALQENELKLRNIFEHSTNVFYNHDINHVIQYISPQVKDILGYEVEDALIKWTEFASDNPINEIGFQNTLKAIETGEVQEPYELELIHKNGKKVWVQVREAPVEENGKTVSIVGSLTDITEQKIAGEKLRESEEKFRTIFNTTIEGICAADYNDKITLVNPRFVEMTGYSIEELSRMNFTELVSPDELENHLALKEVRERGESEIYERKLLRKDGSTFWVKVSASPLLDKRGEYQGSFGMFTDITEKKKMLEDLIEAKEKAEEMNKVKSNFFANMSHELRTPFVGIQGYAELLSSSVSDPEALQMINSIIESSKRLTDTLDKILSLSKYEIEGIEVSKSSVNINELLTDCYNMFVDTTTKKDITFSLILLKTPLVIKSDENLLRGIVSNIINNAIKYTIIGKIELSAKTETLKGKKHLVLKISDTGIGIPKEKQDQIWMAFRQVSEGLNRSFEGTGLGLTITKKYIELLEGTISLESEFGKGSTFTVNLPIEIIKI